jgi:hypothetical protein
MDYDSFRGFGSTPLTANLKWLASCAFGDSVALSWLQVSIIHAIVCESVYLSGAGISIYGPRYSEIELTYLRVKRSSSFWLSFLVSTQMPPLAPPNGMLAIAHFYVISIASAVTSPSYIWVIANPTFERSTFIPMLKAHTVENVNCTIVHSNVDADEDCAFR